MTTEATPVVPGVEDLVVIGRGGFGVVYRGRQEEFGRDVAVKVLITPGVDAKAVERWRREITAMGRLSNHPNIVPIYSAGVTDAGHPYLLMPHVGGGSLHERIVRDGPLPPDELASLGARLAGGLVAAHAAGVLHRDVKPANVLLSEYGEPQLSDFGIARLVDAATTTTGSIQATIGYAAPEVLSGEPATAVADVYGLGATLHAAASGSAPFVGRDGEPMVSRVGRVLTQPPPDLAPAGVPPALAAIIDRCLAKDPALRPPSAEALRDELAALDLAGGAVASTAPARTEVLPVVVPPTAAARADALSDAPAVGSTASAPSDTAGPRRTGPAVIAAALLGLLLVGVLVGWAATRDDGDPTSAGPSSSTEPDTTAPPTSAPTTPSTTEVPTTTVPPTTEAPTTTAPSTTQAPSTTAPPAPDGPRALEQAALDYYATIGGGDVEGGWALLTPGFQEETGGFAAYREFWTEDVASVEVQGRPRADAEAGTVSLRLRYGLPDGGTSTEQVVITLVEADDGRLLIDGYRTGAAGDDEDD